MSLQASQSQNWAPESLSCLAWACISASLSPKASLAAGLLTNPVTSSMVHRPSFSAAI